jgi:hypothetical protein
MSKDTYYFPHDFNAGSDEKILYLRSKFGMQAYGLYWVLIEIMHESSDSKLTCNLIDGIAYQINVDITFLKEFYNECISIELFVTDGVKYWSERVLRNKELLNEKRNLKSIAGKKGMENRWGNKKDITNDNIVITEDNKGNESKVKEIKEKEIKVNKINIIDSAFNEWWDSYDKKISKEKAIAKWNILTSDEKQLALKIVQQYVNSTPDKTFRKDPTTYLNNKSFNDEIIIRNATTSYKPNVSERNFTQLASLKYIEPKRD